MDTETTKRKGNPQIAQIHADFWDESGKEEIRRTGK
jgi:hypothetical protein